MQRWFAWLTLAVLWFGWLGYRALIHSDEGRYAEIALEMMRSGDWITPHLNGFIYFEKPPMQYWMTALAFHLFGVNEFAARLWPALTGFLSVWLAAFTATRLWGERVGVLTGLILAGTTWLLGNAHFLTLDTGLSFFLQLALCAMLLALRDGLSVPASRYWMWLSWAGMAGAVLSKGLIGIVIPGATLVFYSVWTWRWAFWRRLAWFTGSLVFLALTAPWFIAVSARNPVFAHFFFIHEHFERFLSKGHNRPGPWWYFLPILLAGAMPWTSLLPGALKRAIASRQSSDQPALGFLLVWSGFILLFFSASSSKLPSYILPLFPALAMLMAYHLDRLPAANVRKHGVLPMIFWAVPLAVLPFLTRFASDSTPLPVLQAFGAFIAAGATLFLLCAAFAWWLNRQQRLVASVTSLSVGSVLAVSLVFIGHDDYGRLKTSKHVVATIKPWLKADTEVYAVRSYDQTLPYYLGHTVTLVDYVDEFELGQRVDPTRAVPTIEAFAARWQSQAHPVAMFDEATYQLLHQRGVAMQIIYRDARRLVVSKP